MESLNENEYKLIKQYKKTKDDEIALYFFQKFEQDLGNIIYSKINRKFSSVPLEKGDLSHIMWEAIKKTLVNFKFNKNINFNAILVTNTYQDTIKEIRKFLTNKNLINEQAYSFDVLSDNNRYHQISNTIINSGATRSMALQELIYDACEYIKKYSQTLVKRVIYLKSLGYSIEDVAKKIGVSISVVTNIIDDIRTMVDKYY